MRRSTIREVVQPEKHSSTYMTPRSDKSSGRGHRAMLWGVLESTHFPKHRVLLQDQDGRQNLKLYFEPITSTQSFNACLGLV